MCKNHEKACTCLYFICSEAAIKAIEVSVPKGTEEKNIKAFEAGYALAE